MIQSIGLEHLRHLDNNLSRKPCYCLFTYQENHAIVYLYGFQTN